MSASYDAFSDLQDRIVDAIADPMAMAKDFFKKNIIPEDFRDRGNLGIVQQRRTLVEAVAKHIRDHPNEIETVIDVMRLYDATKALADELEDGTYKFCVCAHIYLFCFG